MQILNFMLHWLGRKILSFVKILQILQKKLLRLMFFQDRHAHRDPLFKNWKFSKSSDEVAAGNYMLSSKSFCKTLSKIRFD